ncbi:MAG: hypothetical protein HY982_01965 [Candidatus Magasanikbacteria bacterium]|nr:hypothetical protein [Candidatus Magasanikbacteria bacterium]
MQTFFILGRHSSLSLAEILGLFNREGIEFKIINFSINVLLIETEKRLDAGYLMKQLGGLIKMGEILDSRLSRADFRTTESRISRPEADPPLAEDFGFECLRKTLELLLPSAGKFSFGISYYGGKINTHHLGMAIKRWLKDKGIASRFVVSRQPTLSSVVVKTNKLLPGNGIEISIIFSGEKIYWGRTLAVQDFEEYAFRDYGRPARNLKSGMLPPKLAKIMINLAKAPAGGLILDPFCGGGTILQEALLMGYQAMGSDADERAVVGARENLEWLKRNFSTQVGSALGGQLQKIDARNLSEKISLNSIDAIVTEPYLGPPKITTNSQLSIINNLEQLYLQSWREFYKILKPRGRVVMIWPIFKIGRQKYFLDIVAPIKKIGFQILNLLPPNFQPPADEITGRGSFVYSRPDQRVLREIWVWEKV